MKAKRIRHSISLGKALKTLLKDEADKAFRPTAHQILYYVDLALSAPIVHEKGREWGEARELPDDWSSKVGDRVNVRLPPTSPIVAHVKAREGKSPESRSEIYRDLIISGYAIHKLYEQGLATLGRIEYVDDEQAAEKTIDVPEETASAIEELSQWAQESRSMTYKKLILAGYILDRVDQGIIRSILEGQEQEAAL